MELTQRVLQSVVRVVSDIKVVPLNLDSDEVERDLKENQRNETKNSLAADYLKLLYDIRISKDSVDQLSTVTVTSRNFRAYYVLTDHTNVF